MMRVPAVRALYAPSSLLSTATRLSRPQSISSALRPVAAVQQHQTRQQHAVSNPTLANIEKRWEAMPPQEQAELWMALRDRMTVDWSELTMQEKKACEFLLFLVLSSDLGIMHIRLCYTVISTPHIPFGLFYTSFIYSQSRIH